MNMCAFKPLRWIGLLASAVCALPALAQSPYYVSATITQTGPATCDGTGIFVPATGSFFALLPDVNPNLLVIIKVNGAPVFQEGVQVPGPFPLTDPVVSPLELNGPDVPAPPYTISEAEFPVSLGVPTGTGAILSGVCNGDGSATVTVQSGVPAPGTVDIPALDRFALAALGALLALGGFVGLRRRRRFG
jgi:hypothetical protein